VYLSMAARLNLKQLAFVKHYLGSDDAIAGNASACYRVAYNPGANQKSIHAMASKLLTNPKIKKLIEAATREAIKAVNWSARTVLDESVRLYDRCMGDEAIPEQYIATDRETGIRTAHTVYRRSFNAAGARSALELIGRNTAIQAFQDNVEVSHTVYLEAALVKRAKAVERRALGLPALPGVIDHVSAPGRESEASGQVTTSPGIEADQVDGSLPATAPGHSDPARPAPGGPGKEGASSGGQPNARSN